MDLIELVVGARASQLGVLEFEFDHVAEGLYVGDKGAIHIVPFHTSG